MKPIPMIGKKFGKLTCILQAPYRTSSPDRRYLFTCDCGRSTEVNGRDVRNGKTTSCGCFRRQKTAENGLTHGCAPAGNPSPEYRIWRGMKSRCGNNNVKEYPYYGGRGIRVCERWMEFENFLTDMGLRPAGTTLDRIDNNGDYSPDNCRWATMREQASNRSSNVKFTHNGETMTLSEWATRAGIHRQTLMDRMKKQGLSFARSISKPNRYINARRS